MTSTGGTDTARLTDVDVSLDPSQLPSHRRVARRAGVGGDRAFLTGARRRLPGVYADAQGRLSRTRTPFAENLDLQRFPVRANERFRRAWPMGRAAFADPTTCESPRIWTPFGPRAARRTCLWNKRNRWSSSGFARSGRLDLNQRLVGRQPNGTSAVRGERNWTALRVIRYRLAGRLISRLLGDPLRSTAAGVLAAPFERGGGATAWLRRAA